MSKSREERLELFRKSEASDLLAEVFLDELQFILGENILNRVVVSNQGMNERVHSKDILQVQSQYSALSGERIILTLARNSLYHQLPEILFHPLSLTKANMNVRELVEEIRANRRRAKETIKFFAPFDTAFFRERVKIHQRHLNFFSQANTHKSLEAVIEVILGDELQLSQQQCYKLFLFLCQAEQYKENLEGLGVLLKEVMGLEVRIEYIPHTITEDPYQCLGTSLLGIDSGLSGVVRAELDDLRATILYEYSIPEPSTVKQDIDTLIRILQFFTLSSRAIEVQYTLLGRADFILGENRLGYDTHL